jgi:histidyl-tRNA synthetase
MINQKIQTLKGFKGFYPEDWAFQSWLYQKVKEVSESFGFQEYEGPTVEPLDLYSVKSEELASKQGFTWTDKGGKYLTLRPEMTPTLAKMVALKEGSLIFPIKWFTYGRRFRYEQPQTGRAREFFQWDVDILGSENPESDAEIITIAASFYKKIGLTPNEVKIKINDRKFFEEKLIEIGIPKNKILSVFKIIDKKAKVDPSTFKIMLKDVGLSDRIIKDLDNLLNDKQSYLKSEWLKKIFDLLKTYRVEQYVEFDASIVRGLDYYTRTVFEGWDRNGNLRAIFGGGRYDNLTEDVGGKQKIPGVGFAMGNIMIEQILKANNKYPILEVNKTKVLVTVFSPTLLSKSIGTAKTLRESGINTELYPEDSAKLDKQLKYADKKGIPYVVIIGPEEVEEDKVVLKNLKTKEQTKVSVENLISLVK